jgi:PRC-barrel domain
MNDDTADPQQDRIPTGELDAALPGSPVIPLRTLHNYRIAEGDPDVRGWEVLGADGSKIGEVDDLLVDTHALRARYLEVALDLHTLEVPEVTPGTADVEIPAPPPGLPAGIGGLGSAVSETLVRATLSDEENRLTREHHHGAGTHHVLIPIGLSRLDPKHDRVLVEGLTAAAAAGLPDYQGQRLDPEHEAELRQWFDRTYVHAPHHELSAHDLYDKGRFYGPRRSKAIAETARAAGLEPGATPPAQPRPWPDLGGGGPAGA